MNIEKKAIKIAWATAVLLIFIKIIVWILSSSMVVLTSWIDSLLDLFVSWMNFFAIKKSEEEADENHNYWHGKVEWFWAMFEWIIISISGILIIFFSVNKIISKNFTINTNESLLVMIISICITWSLVHYLSKISKKSNSLILKADTLHYKVDLYTNTGIIISLIIIKILHLPIIDPIVSIWIAIYIIFQSFGIIKEWVNMLMDHKIDDEYIDFIKKTIKSYKQIESYHCLKTRKSWKNNFIEFHIVFKDDSILLKTAHELSDEIEKIITKNTPHSEVIIHLDYYDDSKIK